MKWYTKLRLVLCLIGIAALGIYWCVDRYMPRPLIPDSLVSIVLVSDASGQLTRQSDQTRLLDLLRQCQCRRALLWENAAAAALAQKSPATLRLIHGTERWDIYAGPEGVAAQDFDQRWWLVAEENGLWQELSPLLSQT